MPTTFQLVDTTFPNPQDGDSTEKQLSDIYNYLFVLLEQLRYTLFNLDETNFNEAGLSSITDPIYAKIKNSNDDIAELQLTAQGLAARISDSEGDISQLQLTAQGLSSRVSSAEGSISTLQQTAQGLSSRVSSAEGSISTLQQTASSLSVSVSDLEDAQSTTLFMNSKGVIIQGTGGAVTISGSQLEAGTVVADEIKGSIFYLMDDNDFPAARFSLDGASSWSGTKMMIESGAIEISSLAGDIFLSANGASALQLYADDYKVACLGSFVPNRNSYYDLGASGLYWDTIYCNTSPVDLSDRNHKNSIADLPQKYVEMLSGITPRIFKLNSGKSDRFHAGMIAQEVKEQMDRYGISDTEFAGWCRMTDEEGNETQSLRYGEFIPLLIAKVQQQDRRLEVLERG